MKTLNQMLNSGVLIKVSDNKIILNTSNETEIVFVASLIWPVIDSYYVTLIFTLSMTMNKGVEYLQISKKI